MADYLDHVRRLCALLFIVASGLVFAAIHFPESGVGDRGPVYALLGVAVLAGPFVYWFPWRRYHPNWFLTIGLLATVLTAILIAQSGGRASVFYPIFFFIVVASGAYYTAAPLAFVTILASLGSVAYLFYEPASQADLLRSAFEIPTFFVVAFLCHLLYRHLEQSAALAARADTERRLAEMREAFVDEAGHELKTPLTSLLVAGEFLARDTLPPHQRAQYVGFVQASARRMKETIDDLLTLARFERGKTTLERCPAHLPDLLAEVIEGTCVPGHSRRVSLDVRTTVPVVEVDRHRMRDVFRNLVGNALKYSPGDTPVDVVCEDACGRVVVRVVDRGIGVPRESLPRVFDRFYRAPNIGDLTVLGSGLGLTIAREMVEAHGGEILAESDGEGHGSTFTVVLPVESMGAGVRA